MSSRRESRIGLGTVQLGLSYGINNPNGQTSYADALRLLTKAANSGIYILDTARVYGTSERVLGDSIRNLSHLGVSAPWKIVTKIQPLAELPNEVILNSLKTSLNELGSNAVYAALFHRVDDLKRDPSRMKLLRDLRDQGLITKVGVSAYSTSEIHELLRVDADLLPEIVQIPVNVFDQRAVLSGDLDWLKDRGVEIHARSAFLQGLLTLKPSELLTEMAFARNDLEKWHNLANELKHPPFEIALSYVLSLPQIDRVICGVNTETQLDDLIRISESPLPLPDLRAYAVSDERIIDPSRWPIRS